MLRAVKRWFHEPLGILTTLAYKIARRFEVPYSTFERRGWLPIPLHFYYPFPAVRELESDGYWDRQTAFTGIQLDFERCLALLGELGREFGAECRWPEHSDDPHRYHCANDSFGFTSAAVAHAMVRRLKPQRIIEVGSGYSTHILAGALAANAAGQSGDAELISIEPYPTEVLNTEIPHLGRRIRERVERVERSLFDELGKNDLLFIDSSHVIRYGGDVLCLYLDVLPALRPGVVAHIHDIHLPQPYPRVYFEQQRYVWNEQQLLQAFLCHNTQFEILLPCWMIHLERDDLFRAAFEAYDPAHHRPGSSFWIRRKS
jgi:predicted O-methyltransferase YrrM